MLAVFTKFLLDKNTLSNAASYFSSWYFPMLLPWLGSFPEQICTIITSTRLSVVLTITPIMADPTAVLIQNWCNSSSRTIGKRDLRIIYGKHHKEVKLCLTKTSHGKKGT